jgi:hypothetical protein
LRLSSPPSRDDELRAGARHRPYSLLAPYAVDLSIFLGTRADAQANAAQFPGLDKSRGWSGLASYKHNWTDEWVSNAFASYLAVDLDFRLVNPSVRTKRYGVNLVYTPNVYWAFGVEVDVVDTQIELNGPLGLIPASSLKGQTAYAWIKRIFDPAGRPSHCQQKLQLGRNVGGLLQRG